MLRKFRTNFRKIAFFFTIYALLVEELYFAYLVKVINILFKKIKCYLRKKIVTYSFVNDFKYWLA